MKRLLIIAGVLTCAVGAYAQGTIVLNNRVVGSVVAPIYGPEGNNPASTTILQGNDASGFPVGTQTYTGTTSKPVGTGYTAQIWAGPLGTPDASLTAVAAGSTTFRTGAAAGFIVQPAADIAIPGVPGGGTAAMELRAWDNRGGTITTWAQALADNTVLRGSSSLFNTLPLGDPNGTPPTTAPFMVGLTSFNLYSTAVPEPTTIALGVLGAAGLLLFRRRK